MPVIRHSGRGEPLASQRNQLAELIVQELMGESTRRGPVIFEIPVDSESIDVIVVWEALRIIPTLDRSAIIRDAYARYTKIVENSIHVIDPSRVSLTAPIPKVMMATGVTWDEAEANSILPFAVQPNVRPGEVDSDELLITMRECGAIETASGPQLRFPTPQMAADGHAHLMEIMPEGQWSIVENFNPTADTGLGSR